MNIVFKLDQDLYIVEIYDSLQEWVLERIMTFSQP